MVDVYDDIFDDEALAALAAAAATRGFDHISVSRRGAPRTVAEAAVGSILDALGDASPFVELWWRGEAREVAVHRDVDEKACRRGERCFCAAGPTACPRYGHVLYLDVEPLRAPTCVFEEEGSGGGGPRPLTRLHVIPAVANRLLRFRGDSLHSVALPDHKDAWSYFEEVGGGEPGVRKRAGRRFNAWTGTPPRPARRAPTADAPLVVDGAPPPIVCRPRKQWADAAAAPPGESGAATPVRLCAPLLLAIGCAAAALPRSARARTRESCAPPSRRPTPCMPSTSRTTRAALLFAGPTRAAAAGRIGRSARRALSVETMRNAIDLRLA